MLLGLQAMIAAVQPPLRDTLYLAPVSGSELYKTRREAFTAGIQGCAWLSNEPYQSLRPIGPCEQLILSTRDWYLDASSRGDAYEIGRGLSYLFFQLDMWKQPLEIALELRKRLRAHSVRFVRETHQKGESTPYGLNEVLSEFGQITAEALRQIYYDPSNHMREVWLYVSGDLHKLHNASLHSTVPGGEAGPRRLPALFCHWGRRGPSLPSLREGSSVRGYWPVTEGRKPCR